MATLTLLHYTPDDLRESTPTSPEEILPLLEAGGVTWLHVQGLEDEALLRRLGELLKLHPLALEDVVTPPQRPKAEEYEAQDFVIDHCRRAGAGHQTGHRAGQLAGRRGGARRTGRANHRHECPGAIAMSRRRGYTLVETVTALAVLTVVMGLTLRLIFASDRALGGQDTRAAELVAVSALLGDLGRDLRAAGAVSGGGGRLVVAGPRTVTYETQGGRTLRRVAGLPGEERQYAATMQAYRRGRLVELTIDRLPYRLRADSR